MGKCIGQRGTKSVGEPHSVHSEPAVCGTTAWEYRPVRWDVRGSWEPMASDTKARGYSHSVAGAVTAVQRPGKTGGAGASTGQSEKQGRGPSIETGPGPQRILRNGTDDPEMVLGCCRHRRR